jgi:hypothetical protein
LTAVVEVHKSIAGPKSLLEFLARHNFAGPLEQHRQHLKGLFLKPYLHSVLAQLTALKINCEGRERNLVGGDSKLLPLETLGVSARIPIKGKPLGRVASPIEFALCSGQVSCSFKVQQQFIHSASTSLSGLEEHGCIGK